jgi:exopolyphosphatase/guanosine-5'-triphosphate,3'-diphosphate pyrophosphatase
VPEAIERTRLALSDYADLMRAAGVERVRIVATSATRDAANRDDFFAMAKAELGAVVPGAQAEVITGDEEARLSFAGAVGELSPEGRPFLVVDLGGGSTEFVLGDGDGVYAAHSIDIGCVRITERFLRSDPPATEELEAASEFVRAKLEEGFARVPVEQARTWVGVAGTMTTLAAVGMDLPSYIADRIHLSHITIDEVHQVCERLIRLNRAHRATIGSMHAGRVDVIGAGALITDILARELHARAGIDQLIVSEHDILDGIALSIAPP